MSRRRLPAPPLVLQPMLARVRHGSAQAGRVLELARFLQARGLLTDGGELSLESGLRGRNGVQSLSTQDVRASAHGLALELLSEPQAARWPALAEAYYQRFDRGKPRRPSRLQRLYLEWSADLGPLGLLQACRTHPRLWKELHHALASLDPDQPDARLLTVLSEAYVTGDWSSWLRSYETAPQLRASLLQALPLLPHPPLTERLRWLSQTAASDPSAPRAELLIACRRTDTQPATVPMPAPLVSLCLKLVADQPGEVEAEWLAALRGYQWPRAQLDQLSRSLQPDDPVHGIVYGARTGRLWLRDLLAELADASL
jgi:hypothetical protein